MAETLMAIVLLLGGALASVSLIDGASGTTSSNKAREGATNLQREIVDTIRSIPYGSLTSAQIETELKSRPELADSSPAAGYTVARRGHVYTVTLDSCALDDAKDGTGAHDVSVTFCPDTDGPGTKDRNADDYRRITVDLSWKRQGRTEQSRQTSIVTNPAGGLGPSVASLTMTGQTSPVTSPTVTQLDFDVTFSSTAETASWALNGDVKGNASGSGTGWSFTWNLAGWDDGTYIVHAQGFDEDGRSGVARKLTVVLNRSAPDAPSGFDGGRNGNGADVDLEWLASSEGDVIGYRVYRTDSAGAIIERACPAAAQGNDAYVTATSCTDEAAPSSGTLHYKAVALDVPPAGGIREGTATAVHTVSEGNTVPTSPGSPTVCAGGDPGCTLPDGSDAPSGTTVVSWTASSDPDSGDSVAFYRIYRDGTGYSDRYGRVYSDGTLKFVDTAPGGTSRTYRVTAVDQSYGESAPSAAVTG